MSEKISYQEIHAYMLRKTKEYYADPPAVLVEAVIARYKADGLEISYEDAAKQVSLIDIQRYLKLEMQKKWPEFMGSLPSNPLKDR